MKQEEIVRKVQEMSGAIQAKSTGAENDQKVEEAVYKIMDAVRPQLERQHGKADVLQYLDKVANWISMMPESLHPEQNWSRKEFNAVLSGPAEQNDPKFDDYMDAFYEEYKGNNEDEHQEFYMRLFQSQQQISEVDWMTIWDSFRASYENWRKIEEEDAWLKGEMPQPAAAS